MHIDRRTFTSGMLSAAVGSAIPAPVLAQVSPAHSRSVQAIRSFAEADLAFNHLPGMTLGIVTPEGQRTILNFGVADLGTRAPIGPGDLFQIGSITKSMVAFLVHQLAAEGRIRLTDRVSNLLPGVALPTDNRIEVQHLLDHVAGLPDDAPMFARGGLWTAYPPGAHWHYSNTGYEILGKLVEQLRQRPLAQILHERIFMPLAMNRSRGAIVYADRLSYAQGYEPADRFAPYLRGAPLAAAPWVDVTFGAGCVASTADDMLSYLLALARAARGQGVLGLSPEQARLFCDHAVPSDSPEMHYGNGLMHVGGGGRTYLHHTGGMVSFSSSFHVDPETGVGAFASSNLSAFADYRPRLLTAFAVDALANERLGRSRPATPPLDLGLPNAASYLGRYAGRAGAFEIRPGLPLTISAHGQSAPLIPVAEDIFRTRHPLFDSYGMMFDRSSGTVTVANWGPNAYVREGTGATAANSDPTLALLAGRYVNDNPWFGPLPVVERAGKLWIGTETPMSRIGDNLWLVGKESWSPERASFADFLGGRPQSFIFSGVTFVRHDI